MALTSGGSAERLGDLGHVDDDGFDAVAFALDLGADARHLVAVERVRHVPVHVDRPHGEGRFCTGARYETLGCAFTSGIHHIFNDKK